MSVHILLIHLCKTSKPYPLPYPCPMVRKLHPPNWSIISDGHSIALNLSLKACLNPWITYLSDSLPLSHLFRAALALLVLHPFKDVYLGKANKLPLLCSRILIQAHSDSFVNGIYLSLALVFKRLHEWGMSLI